MNLTNTKRLSSLAFAGLLCTFAIGCGGSEGEPQPAVEEMAVEHTLPEDEVSAMSISCPGGWHAHYATWPTVGMYYVGQCSSKAYTISSGTWVCMRDGSPTSCGGQGYADVYQPGSAYYYWARMEAFNGH